MACSFEDLFASARRARRAAPVVLLLIAHGCASEDALPDDAEPVIAEREAALIAPLPQQASDPRVPIVASVVANGSGCPAGTWQTEITSDGTTFSVYFDQYYARLVDGEKAAVKDCSLAIRLKSPSDLSYSVTEFFYRGSVALEPGVNAFQSAYYYFQGNPRPDASQTRRTDIKGPANQSYEHQDTIPATSGVWSPCGLERELNVITRIGATKNQATGEGTITMFNVDANIRGKIEVKVAYRRCGASAAAPTPSTGSTRPGTGTTNPSGTRGGNNGRGGRR